MARIFLSHSSADELDAVAVRDWLAENGWGKDDIFLDLDPTHGLTAGERWQHALRQAADRCEAVVFIISPDWAKSKWCLTEFLLAHNLNKRIFGVVVKTVVIAELPVELTAEWQLGYLVGDGPLTDFEFTHKEQTHRVHWLTHGLNSLRNGLAKAGIGANHFNWPPLNQPDRAPYRGLEPLDEIDAAIYFGRDTQILQGLDILRGMRNGDGRSLFVILGPSGSGKSSFLRAGLLPRLKRDDRHFFILDIIRPGSHVISGDNGLANSLYKAWSELDLTGKTLGDIKAALMQNPAELLQLLTNIQIAAAQRVQLTNEKSPPPTLILAIDQAEELFQADAKESELFLNMLGHCLAQNNYHQPLLILAFTIRSDRYEPLQTAAGLTDYKSALFDGLKPLPTHCYKEVILGPAQQASKAGNKLEINPDLVDRLLEDFGKGGDPLPMLSLTLALLFKDYGSDGDLRLDEYEKLGGMEKVVNNIFESILSVDVQQRKEQLNHLRNAFIPHLASINIQNNQIMRRQAFYRELPTASHSLINALLEKRLLVTDQQSGGKTIEVAHEAVLRQWGDLQTWLEEERENLKLVQSLEQAANDWAIKKDPAWLWHGVRLKAAEDLKQLGNYENVINRCQTFLNESRKLEITELERKEQQLQKIRRGTQMLGVAIVFLLMLGVWGKFSYDQSQERFRNAISLSLLSSFKNHPLKDGWLMLLAATKIHHNAKVQGALLDVIQANKRIVKIITTSDLLNAVTFSPDGTRFLSADFTDLRLWDAKTGNPIGEPLSLNGYEDRIANVALSPDGASILSVDNGKTLRLWDSKSGQPLGEPLRGHEEFITSFTFSRDGTRILSGSANETVFWDAKTGKPIGEPLRGYANVTFSPDGTRILSRDQESILQVRDAKTGNPIGKPFEGYKKEGFKEGAAATFSPDGTRILSRNDERILQVRDAKTGNPIGKPFKGHEAEVSSMAFSPDGTRILSGDYEGILQIWDASTGEPIDTIKINRDFADTWEFSSDGTRAVSLVDNRTLSLLDIRETLLIDQPLVKHEDPVSSVAFTPDGTRILSRSYHGTLHLLDANTGLPIGEPLKGPDGSVNSAAFSPDGNRAVTGSQDGALHIWDVKTGKPIGEPLIGHTGFVSSVVFSPDGTRILSGSEDGTLHLWDTQTGQPIVDSLKGHKGQVYSVTFSPDGARILSSGQDGILRLWNATTGQPIWDTGSYLDIFTSLAFSPDGARILSGGRDTKLRLWEAETGQPIGNPLSGHEDKVISVAFSPDGSFILSGADITLRLWDAETGESIGEPLKGNEWYVSSVAFSPDGKRMLSGSDDGIIRVWPAPSAWPAELCKKLTRNMSHKEWREWVSPDIDYIKQCPGLPIPPDAPKQTEIAP